MLLLRIELISRRIRHFQRRAKGRRVANGWAGYAAVGVHALDAAHVGKQAWLRFGSTGQQQSWNRVFIFRRASGA